MKFVKRSEKFFLHFPVETVLYFLLFAGLLYNLYIDPNLVHPSSFVLKEDIISDLHICPVAGNLSRGKKPMCPILVDNLVSDYPVQTEINNTLLKDIPLKYNIRPGGSFKPDHCWSHHRVALIIPYKNRETQLKLLLQHLHPFLVPQLVEYTVYLIEQYNGLPFNKGVLFNAGFIESLKLDPTICCFILHDADIVPQNQNHIYACSRSPRHMVTSLNTFRYKLIYKSIIGGIVAIQREQYERVNGFSNMYKGWGGEDDDFAMRVLSHNLTITRWEPSVSRFVMFTHKKEKPSKEGVVLLNQGSRREHKDGLHNVNYKVISIDPEPLFTRILVDGNP